MKVLDFYTQLLIPGAQLFDGVRELYRRAISGANTRGGPYVFVVAGLQVRSLRHGLLAVVARSLDTLSLVNAWFTNGVQRTPDERERMRVLVNGLVTEWRHEFVALAKDAGLPQASHGEFLRTLGGLSRKKLWTKPQAVDSLRDRLTRFSKRLDSRISEVWAALGYSPTARSEWLSANVNRRHPLTSDGAISKWRTLASNSSFEALGRSLGHGDEGVWTLLPTTSTRPGVERAATLLATLDSAVSQEEPNSASDDFTLPGNYQIARVPSGHVCLRVALRPLKGFSWVTKANTADLAQFMNSLSESEKELVSLRSRDFVGSLAQGAQLFRAARAAENERTEVIDGLEARFQALAAQQREAGVREKLGTLFSEEERTILRALLGSTSA